MIETLETVAVDYAGSEHENPNITKILFRASEYISTLEKERAQLMGVLEMVAAQIHNGDDTPWADFSEEQAEQIFLTLLDIRG